MKKKLLTTVLTVGMVLSLVGCGAKETTSSESVAETTEVTTEYGTEETTVEEVVEETTVAEEPAKEKIPVDLTDGAAFMKQMLQNYESQKYIAAEFNQVSNDINNPSAKTEFAYELLYDWNNNIACSLADNLILYYDYNEEMAYSSKDDMTGFYKLQANDTRQYMDYQYNTIKDYVERDYNYTVTELTEGDYAGNYCATNIFNVNDNLYAEHKVYVDAYTLLPICVITTAYDSNHELVLEDGTTVSGEDFILIRCESNYQYLTEDDTDFATFQSAIQLPADDECEFIEAEGETTTTE